MKTERSEEPEARNVIAALHKRVAIIATILIIVVAGATGVWLMRQTYRGDLVGRPVPTPDFDVAPSAMGDAATRPGDMLITIPLEKLENARLKLEAAASQPLVPVVASGLRTTGTVEPNAYKVTPVTLVAGGVVREVHPLLGDKVERGQKLATIFSTEMADAHAAYLSILAEIEKHHQKYRRAEKLVEIGASSREEFEEVSAEYKIEQARLAAARQRLLLLGMSMKQVDELRDSNQLGQTGALIPVDAPASGTILSRSVNAGEVVTAGKELFRIADLSTVWVIGQIYEKDFAIVRIGAPAVITAQAYPGRTFAARVSYIDPRVDPQTRTAQIRIEVGNPGGILKLGMFVDLSFGGAAANATSGRTAVSIPRSAVQMIGAKQFVFVAINPPGVFAQREVNSGQESNGVVPIYAGLNAGDRVVTEGSFLLRAESLKINPSQLAGSQNQSATAPQSVAQQLPDEPYKATASQPVTQSVTVTLNEQGYQPETFSLRRGVPARITFVRKADASCGSEVVLADYNIKRELPLNQPVVVEFTPAKTGEFKFACGMDMLRGKIIVK